MIMTKSYHDDTDQKAHSEYVRIDCFTLAMKRYPYLSIPELVETAREIEKYIFDQRPCPVEIMPTKSPANDAKDEKAKKP